VFQLPYRSGTSRQGAPVRSRHKMPLMTLRLCSGGRPRPRLPTFRSTGNNTFRIRHSTSVRSPRLKAASPESAALNQFSIRASIILSTPPRTRRMAAPGKPPLELRQRLLMLGYGILQLAILLYLTGGLQNPLRFPAHRSRHGFGLDAQAQDHGRA